LIILTADQGDGFMEHGFLSHSRAPYDELCRVPLIVKFPNQRHAGNLVAGQVRLIDVMPTVLDVAGIPDHSRPSMDGASLVPLTAGHQWLKVRKPQDHPAITEILLRGKHLTVAVRDGHYKFIMGDGRSDELYDLNRDPGETTNLAGSGGPAEKRLRDQALRVIEEGSQGRSSRVPVDSKTQKDIRGLGYVE
jgi:choline-sulfatase